MDEPIDLAQKTAERGNPWFGLGSLLTGNEAGSASGTLTLADIEALHERMFDNEVQAETTTMSNAKSPPVTVESLEAIVKQFPPMDVPLPLVDFKSLLQEDTEEQKGVLTLGDIRALQERLFYMAQGNPDYIVVSPYVAANWERWERRARHSMPRDRAMRKRAARWHKIRKRQRRAAQRRHARGER